MPDEETQTGVPAAEVTDDNQQTGKPAAEVENPEIAAFKAKAEDEVKKRQAIELENQQLKQQMALSQANPQQVQQQMPQDVFSRAGIDDNTPITAGEARQYAAETNQQLLASFQYQNFIAQNPDFNQIVGTVLPGGQIQTAEPLKVFIQENPTYAGLDIAAARDPNWARVAHKLAKDYKQLKDYQARVNAIDEQKKLIDEKTTPLSPAALGGGGGAVTNDLSDAQVDEIDKRIKAGEFG